MTQLLSLKVSSSSITYTLTDLDLHSLHTDSSSSTMIVLHSSSSLRGHCLYSFIFTNYLVFFLKFHIWKKERKKRISIPNNKIIFLQNPKIGNFKTKKLFLMFPIYHGYYFPILHGNMI